jgi:HEAT repeat protein
MIAYAEDDFAVDFARLFRQALTSGDERVRRLAIEGLWEDERPETADKLVEMMAHDPALSVRAAAAAGLGRYVFMAECEELDARRGRAIRQALEQAATQPDQDLDVKRRAIEALAFINDEQVRRLIDAAYAHPEQRMRESALFAMGRSAESRWTEPVLTEMDSDIVTLRYEAARACGEIQIRRGVPRLIELTQDVDREVQATAIWSLGQIGGKQARRALERLLESEDPEISAAAEEAISESEIAHMALNLLVHDPDQAEMVDVNLDDEALDDDDADDLDEDWDDDDDEDSAFLSLN